MDKVAPTSIRIPITKEVRHALNIARKRNPALSDSEIPNLGLLQIAAECDEYASLENEGNKIRRGAAYALGQDYLQDEEEDLYTEAMGKKVKFS